MALSMGVKVSIANTTSARIMPDKRSRIGLSLRATDAFLMPAELKKNCDRRPCYRRCGRLDV